MVVNCYRGAEDETIDQEEICMCLSVEGTRPGFISVIRLTGNVPAETKQRFYREKQKKRGFFAGAVRPS